MQKDAEASAK
jgi:hypothetical protein